MEHLVTYYKAKIISNKPAANAALEIIDVSPAYLHSSIVAVIFWSLLADRSVLAAPKGIWCMTFF